MLDSAPRTRRAAAAPSALVSPASEADRARLKDPGAGRNVFLQFLSNMAGFVFTGVLTLFLVRALGPSGYGQYALAVTIAGLLVLPTGLGLPMAVGRYLADNRNDVLQVRAILALGLRLLVPATLVVTICLLAAAGLVAKAYGDPGLEWPLRCVALSVMGQALYTFLVIAGTSLRQAAVGLRLALVESATETSSAILLVVLGTGAAGAALGRSIGYVVAALAGVLLIGRLIGRVRQSDRTHARVSARQVLRYSSATFVVDVGYTLIARLDILLIGALLTSAAVGSFSAVFRIVTVLGYLGTAVSGGVAPRLSLAGGKPDTRAFNRGVRYLLVVQGLVLAPMIVWARPLVELLLGPGYERSVVVMQVLSVTAFVSAPAALLSVSVNYLGAAQRRVKIIFLTLLLGVVATYVLIDALGLVGAAVADDVVTIVYVVANLWLCAQLISVGVRSLIMSVSRVLVAAGLMALVLWIVGTDHLSPAQWVIGGVAGLAAYLGGLLICGEVSVLKLRVLAARFSAAARPVKI
jgi:O-antigen/teichoic acid export membrane protein